MQCPVNVPVDLAPLKLDPIEHYYPPSSKVIIKVPVDRLGQFRSYRCCACNQSVSTNESRMYILLTTKFPGPLLYCEDLCRACYHHLYANCDRGDACNNLIGAEKKPLVFYAFGVNHLAYCSAKCAELATKERETAKELLLSEAAREEDDDEDDEEFEEEEDDDEEEQEEEDEEEPDDCDLLEYPIEDCDVPIETKEDAQMRGA